MIEIKEGQKLEVNNLLSFRGKVKQDEIEKIGKDMESYIERLDAKKVDNPITATFLLENDLIDFEILIPINKKIVSSEKYVFKEKLKITNAIVGIHRGNPDLIQNTLNELNQYILENKILPITVGYSVIKNVELTNLNETVIYYYLGINSNIL